jgi:hypothetical protein
MQEQSEVVREDFVTVLKKIRKGECVFELSQELEKIVAGVQQHKKAGSLTLKISIMPFKSNDSYTLLVTEEITSKIPKAVKDPSIFFASDKNTLHTDDPHQKSFSFEK